MNFEEAQRRVMAVNRHCSQINPARESPEYLYESFTTLADMIEEEMGQPGEHPVVSEVRRACTTLMPMFGMFGAQAAWNKQREALSWREKRGVPKEAPQEFKDLWSWKERARAQADIRALLEKLS